jgi:hypothetical protein
VPSRLRDTLRRNTVETMLGNAQLTVRTADSPERTEEARRQVRMVLYESALGQITREEREQILAILRPYCPDMLSFEPAQDDPYAAPAFLDDAEHCSADAPTDMA